MSDPSQERQEEQQRSLERIEAGGIPLSAERRLRELAAASGGRDAAPHTLTGTPPAGAQPREAGTAGRTFTSDLSVNGFAMCRQLGLTPLSQVMGSSVYQMGYQAAWRGIGFGAAMLMELDSLSQALNEVRGKSLSRLAEEARLVGADAVVAVQTRSGQSELETGTVALEHVTFGTAVRREGARAEHPVLTELSVAEYAMLVQGGFEPVGIVAWSSVFFTSYVFSGMLGEGAFGGGAMGMGARNFELREFTQTVYSAREQVMARITGQASALGAAGVVGVRIGHSVQPRTLGGGVGTREVRGLMVTFDAIGTAIVHSENATAPTPKPVIDLSS